MRNSTITKRQTELGNSYFNGDGAYQKEYDELWKKMVPSSGTSKTLNGELIRAIGRLTYEYFNNGNCNAFNVHYVEEKTPCSLCNGSGTIMDEDEDGEEIEVTCSECGGEGYFFEEVEDDCSVTSMFRNFLRLIETSIPDASLFTAQVMGVIKSNLYSSDAQFSKNRMKAYSELADEVVYYVLTNNDSDLPNWYLDAEEND